MTHHIREDCMLCGAATDRVLHLGETPLANEYLDKPAAHQERFPLFLACCRSCGHVQMPVVVDPARLFGDYRYTTSTTVAMRDHCNELSLEVVAENDTPLIVDIGSNDGTLIAYLAARGADAIGVEPCAALAAQASAEGFITIPTFLGIGVARGIRRTFGRADAVTALNVLAHSADVIGMLRAIRELLGSGAGKLWAEVGRSDSIEAGIVDLVYHEHLHFHAPGPFSEALDRCGLSLIEASQISTQGASWRFVANTAGERLTFQKPEYDWPMICAKAEQKRAAIREAVSRFDMVGMYGCPAKATTLIHYCGLAEKIAFCVDDNPLKVGRYVPGTNIPILPVSALETEQADALLLAAWNFADEIMDKRAAYRGKWIVPYPEVRVV